MSSSDYREPTNDELWAQPPTTVGHVPSPQGLVPMPPPPLPAPTHSLPPAVPAERPDRTVFVLAIVTTALGIPLTAIASAAGGQEGLLIAWVGIVGVNVVYARSRRRK